LFNLDQLGVWINIKQDNEFQYRRITGGIGGVKDSSEKKLLDPFDSRRLKPS
jgi:hypothetical protein